MSTLKTKMPKNKKDEKVRRRLKKLARSIIKQLKAEGISKTKKGFWQQAKVV